MPPFDRVVRCRSLSVAGRAAGGYSSTVAPPENWAMRKMTNSAGFTGAMPISTTSWPASRDSGGLVSSSHLTKKAWSGVAPNSAPVAPDAQQEGVDRPLHTVPQAHVVRLEDDPLGALDDRLLDVVEEPPDVEVAPRRVARERPRAPDPDAAAGERADAVDPDRVELVVLGLRDVQLERDRAADDLVGRAPCGRRGCRRCGPRCRPCGRSAGRSVAWPDSGSKTLIHGQ